MISHSAGCGAGNQPRAEAYWEPALASGQKERSELGVKTEEELTSQNSGKGKWEGGWKEGNFLEAP